MRYTDIMVPYQDPPGSTFTHDGKIYDLNKLLVLIQEMDTREFRVDDLIWIIQYDQPDIERLKKVVLTGAPIIVTIWEGRLVTLDGLHRITKAKLMGLDNIQGKLVDQELLDLVYLADVQTDC